MPFKTHLFPLVMTLALAFAGSAFGEEKAAGPTAGEGATANDAKALEPSDHYVHSWTAMPSFTATGLGDDQGPMSVGPRPGRALVVLFLASWCEPCQQLMADYQVLEKRYRRLGADFVYVFAHDTQDDAQGFMKEFGLSRGILANHDVLKAYHNPELPTIYLGDRRGWLTTRYVKAGATEVERLDGLLRNLTAY